MYILGFNLPLAEFMFFLVVVLFACLVIIIFHLRKLEQMTSEERAELQELEKMTLEEKDAIDKMSQFETEEQQDLTKFEADIKELEGKDTMYMQKVIPDIYTLQNYTLWALKKGMSSDEIRSYLESKGWKDKDLVDMVIDDMSRYVKYYGDRKGDTGLPVVKIQETTRIIKPTKIITREKIVDRKPRKAKKAVKKSDKTLDTVEEELKKLEEDIKRSGKSEPKEVAKTDAKPKKVTTKAPPKKAAKPKEKTVKKQAKTPQRSRARRSSMVIGTKGGNKYHDATCIVMKKSPKNKVVTFKSPNEALKKGYKPCTVCQVERKAE
jgi:hypothetical protein